MIKKFRRISDEMDYLRKVIWTIEKEDYDE
jgi:hypothetical protein